MVEAINLAGRVDFELAFELVIGSEGSYSADPRDPGNYTRPNMQGTLKGTKWGISALAYPDLDIKNLAIADAHAIYIRDYWEPAGCHELPPRAAYVVFDCAVNNGVGRAVRLLQTALNVAADGVLGPQTRTARDQKLTTDVNGNEIAREVHAQRIHFMAGLATWKTFGLGWSRRLAAVPYDATLSWPATIINDDDAEE